MTMMNDDKSRRRQGRILTRQRLSVRETVTVFESPMKRIGSGDEEKLLNTN